MKNSFGQEINPGDIVGLGIRSGNHSEQRVGIVLQLITEEQEVGFGNHRGTVEHHYGKCAWYDASRYGDQYPGSKVMISRQMFRFFLLDPDTIDPKIVIALVAAYQEHT
jgi:hypothetical protein